MRYLLTSFCCIWMIVSCSSYPKKQQLKVNDAVLTQFTNPYFSDLATDYVYKAHINVFDNDFGGLLIIKKIDDQHHRVAFTTEMGTKIFDFSFNETDFKVNYILEDLDKKLLINILKQDFSVLINEHLNILQTFKTGNVIIYETEINNKKHYYYVSNDKLNRVVSTKNGKEKVRFQFSEISNTIAKQIQITHSNIPLEINLKSIK